MLWLFVGPTRVYLLDLFCSGIQFNTVESLSLLWERSGSVVERLTRDRGAGGFESHQGHCVVVLEQDTFILA